MTSKKVVMIIAARNFRDEELFKTKAVLERAGYQVSVASSTLALAVGMLGGKVKPDLLFKDIRVADYDAVIFVGGAGATEYWDSAIAHKLAEETLAQEKVLGAICFAPVTLARAGVLRNKKATVWASEQARLVSAGADYTGNSVEIDGKTIITADGPSSAEAFGKALVTALAGS